MLRFTNRRDSGLWSRKAWCVEFGGLKESGDLNSCVDSFLELDGGAGVFDADPDASESIKELMSISELQRRYCPNQKTTLRCISQGSPFGSIFLSSKLMCSDTLDRSPDQVSGARQNR